MLLGVLDRLDQDHQDLRMLNPDFEETHIALPCPMKKPMDLYRALRRLKWNPIERCRALWSPTEPTKPYEAPQTPYRALRNPTKPYTYGRPV